MRQMVKDFVADAVKDLDTENAKVLDIGSLDVNGNVREYFKNYIGVDNSSGKNVDWVGDAKSALAYYGEEQFNIILCLETLEHDDNPVETMKCIRKMLKPSGAMIVTVAGMQTPMHRYPFDFFRFMPDSFDEIFFKGFEVYKKVVTGDAVMYAGIK